MRNLTLNAEARLESMRKAGMEPKVLPNEDLSWLDKKLLDADGRLKLLPVREYAGISPLHLALWGHQHAVYQFPTVELVKYLKEKIAGRSALEICAGNSCLGYHLGIRSTDDYQQTENPETAIFYMFSGQPPTRPDPAIVERIDALAAVEKYRPQVVVGSFVTQNRLDSQRGEYDPAERGNAFGVDEERLLTLVESYYHVGHLKVHGNKRICRLPHAELALPCLVTRSLDPGDERVFMWEMGAPSP